VIRPATEADYDAYARLATELRVDDAPVPRTQFTAELLPRMIVVSVGDQVVATRYPISSRTPATFATS
jgi:hypothetical protein